MALSLIAGLSSEPFGIKIIVAVGYGLLGLLLAREARRAVAQSLDGIGLASGTVTIGDDGVEVTGTKGAGFIHYSDVTDIRLDRFRRQVVIERRAGEPVRFRVANRKGVAAVIAGRRELARWNENPPPAIPNLGVVAEDMPGWIARASRLLSGGYRDGVLTADQLATVAADPSADPDQRIGAALALKDAPPAVRMRVRVAAEEAARPHLAEAMTQAVEGDLEEELLARAIE